ncbi:hypothetical protein YC2023_005604 [Brassica napus]
MASKALNNTANDSTEQITAISDLKPKHTTKMVHVKVLHSWSQNINHGGGNHGIPTVVSRSNFMNDDLYLNLVDFQSVLSGTLDEKYLIDVLGQVLDCGAVETIQCAGGNQRKKLEFTLRDIK